MGVSILVHGWPLNKDLFCLSMHIFSRSSSFVVYLIGTTALHNELEECVANFVGKPAALVFGMGYVTNSAILPVLMEKVCECFVRVSCWHIKDILMIID